MSIDDQILIGSAHDYRSVFRTYLEGRDTDVNIVEEPYYIRADDTRWNGGASPVLEQLIATYENVLGFRPTISMSFCLEKTDILGMQTRLIFGLFPLIERIKCNIVYAANYSEILLRYKDGQLEIKTKSWYRSELEKIPLPYIELPDLFF
jgi:hypothetical protein